MKLPDLITLIARAQICNQILEKSFARVECCYFLTPVKAPSVENESCSSRILLSIHTPLVHPLLHGNFKILPSHNPLAYYTSLFTSRKEYISRVEVDTLTSSKFVIDLGHVAKVFRTRLASRIRGILFEAFHARDRGPPRPSALPLPWNI